MAETISKAQLTDEVAQSAGMKKNEAKAAVAALFEHIALHLKQGDKISVTGFGSFEVRERSARQGVRPGTSEKIAIPASKAPAFKAGKSLKDSVNG